MTDIALRLLVWNCAGAFRRKASVVAALAPDIAVLSEVPENCGNMLGSVASAAWTGIRGSLGLAVVGFNGWRIEPDEAFVNERLFLPAHAVRCGEQFRLIGVCSKRDGDYVTPTIRALSNLSSFIEAGPTIVAGDFNQSAIFDAKRKPVQQFRQVAEKLAKLNLASAWHQHHEEDFGAESAATLFWRWNDAARFHIDYAFVPRPAEVLSATLGSYEDYVLKRLSDHVPLLIEMRLPHDLADGISRETK